MVDRGHVARIIEREAHRAGLPADALVADLVAHAVRAYYQRRRAPDRCAVDGCGAVATQSPSTRGAGPLLCRRHADVDLV